MCFGSGAQAQLAAAQVASEAQRQSFEEALGFQRENLAIARQDRAPYLDAGRAGLSMWTNLLGLNNGNYANYAPGGGGTLKNLASYAPGGGASTSGGTGSAGAANLAGTASFTGEKFPGLTAQPYKVGDVGKEQTVPGNRPTLPNPNVPDPNPIPWVPPGTIPIWPPRL